MSKDPGIAPVLTYERVTVPEDWVPDGLVGHVNGITIDKAYILSNYLLDFVIPALAAAKNDTADAGFPENEAYAFLEDRGLVIAATGSKYVDATTELIEDFEEGQK